MDFLDSFRQKIHQFFLDHIDETTQLREELEAAYKKIEELTNEIASVRKLAQKNKCNKCEENHKQIQAIASEVDNYRARIVQIKHRRSPRSKTTVDLNHSTQNRSPNRPLINCNGENSYTRSPFTPAKSRLAVKKPDLTPKPTLKHPQRLSSVEPAAQRSPLVQQNTGTASPNKNRRKEKKPKKVEEITQKNKLQTSQTCSRIPADINTKSDDHTGIVPEGVQQSPNGRGLGVDKVTFLNEMELGNAKKKITSRVATPQKLFLRRSQSCDDLSLLRGRERQKVRARRFFTPCKKNLDVNEEFIKATLRELIENKDLPERLANSINQARESIPKPAEDTELDLAIQSIVDKTAADPAFDSIMEETLSNFDLLTYLKPLENSGRRKLAGDMGSKEKISSVLPRPEVMVELKPAPPPECEGSMLSTQAAVSTIISTSEQLQYPNIQYEAVDCNIVTGSLDEFGSCLLNPSNSMESVSSTTNAPNRYRKILPKFPNFDDLNASIQTIHPVIVVTPLMPPPSVENVKPVQTIQPVAVTKKKKVFASKKQKPTIKSTDIITPANQDMPALNFFATPMQNESTTPSAPIPPKRSCSTPRNKSHVRALEFGTPRKTGDVKRPTTSPKKTSEVTSTTQLQSPLVNFKKKNPPVATRTPGRKKLSEAWDSLTGVNCVFGTNEKLETPSQVANKSLSPNKSQKKETINTCKKKKSPEKSVVFSDNEAIKDTSKSWDSALRTYVSETEEPVRMRRTSSSIVGEKSPKEVKKKARTKTKAKAKAKAKPKPDSKNKKGAKVNPTFVRTTRSKTVVSVSPSKLKGTSRRSTYAVTNEDSSPDQSVTENTVVEMTPAKELSPFSKLMEMRKDVNSVLMDLETPGKECNNPEQDTPFTKLLKENVPNVDIDLSMLPTPCFPATPSLALPMQMITPLPSRPTDYSSSSSYYKPDLTSPHTPFNDIDIPHLQKSEEHLQDITTISGRNIVQSPPRAANTSSSPNRTVPDAKATSESANDLLPKSNSNENLEENNAGTTNPKEDETSSINICKETSSTAKQIDAIVNKAKKIAAEKKIPGKNMSFLKIQMIAQCDKTLLENMASPYSEEKVKVFRDDIEKKKEGIFCKLKESKKRLAESDCSPEAKRKKVDDVEEFRHPLMSSTPSKIRVTSETAEDFLKEIPKFVDDGEFPELKENTKKKLHVIKCLILRPEVQAYLARPVGRLQMRPSLRVLFGSLHKWLKHPHKHEVEASAKLRLKIKEYRVAFRRIHQGFTVLNEPPMAGVDCMSEEPSDASLDELPCSGDHIRPLPLKKRKNAKQDTQSMLKGIDVESFLSHVHGQQSPSV